MLWLLVVVSSAFASNYDNLVLQDNPVAYFKMGSGLGSATEPDASGKGHVGRYYPVNSRPAKTRMPNGDLATVFDGFAQYLETPDSRYLSVRKGGALTLEAWIRPDTLQFPSSESDGYVHWAGKGEPNEHEYAMRMYSRTNSASRPNRVSGYVFNLSGGLGSGSYFQDPMIAGQWMHVALVIQTRTRPGTVSIYKNGVLRDTTPLSQFQVVPHEGRAPLRIATRDLNSYFKGAIGKFAVYAYPVTATRLLAHVQAMR